MKYIITTLLVGLFCFSGCAFVQWQIDPALWPIDVRVYFLIGLSMFLIPLLSFIATNE